MTGCCTPEALVLKTDLEIDTFETEYNSRCPRSMLRISDNTIQVCLLESHFCNIEFPVIPRFASS